MARARRQQQGEPGGVRRRGVAGACLGALRARGGEAGQGGARRRRGLGGQRGRGPAPEAARGHSGTGGGKRVAGGRDPQLRCRGVRRGGAMRRRGGGRGRRRRGGPGSGRSGGVGSTAGSRRHRR